MILSLLLLSASDTKPEATISSSEREFSISAAPDRSSEPTGTIEAAPSASEAALADMDRRHGHDHTDDHISHGGYRHN